MGYMEYEIDNTGYSNSQVHRGYLALKVKGLKPIVDIRVEEWTSSGSGHDVRMFISFLGTEPTERVETLEFFQNVKEVDEDTYEILDEALITDLFSNYGNNFSS